MAWQVAQHQGLFVCKANWLQDTVSSTLPRLGLLATLGYYVSGMLDAQWIAVNGKAEKPSCRTSWPKCSKSITMCRPLDSQNSLLHGIALSEKWLIKIASSSAHTNGSRASEHFVAESVEGRRTHTRSVIITTNGEKCGHWIQICENTRRYVVFVQSAAKHRKSLIFNKWSTCSVGGTHFSCHIQLLLTVVEREF